MDPHTFISHPSYASLSDIIGALFLSISLSYFLALGYEWTYQGLSYQRRFVHSLILSCVTSCILMLALNNQIAVGLGLIGMMAMVRFRINIRDLWDMSFVFTSLTLGVCCGLRYVELACALTLGSVAVAGWLSRSGLGYRAPFDGLVRFWWTPQENETALTEIQNHFKQLCRSSILVSVRQAHQGDTSEYCYQVALKPKMTADVLVEALQKTHGVSSVHLLMQDQHLEV